MDEISSHAALLISLISLDLDVLIFLFWMYLAMQNMNFFKLDTSEDKCPNNPWREMGWKLPSHSSGSVG